MCWRCVQGLLPYGFIFGAIGVKGSWRLFARVRRGRKLLLRQ